MEALRQRLEAVWGDWKDPLSDAEIDAVAARLEGTLPAELRWLWRTLGVDELSFEQARVTMYIPDNIPVFVDDFYSESLPGLAPFASYGSSWEYCVALRAHAMFPTGAVVLNSRGCMAWPHCHLVAPDLTAFFGAVLDGEDPLESPSLSKLWTEANLDAAQEALRSKLSDPGVTVSELHFRTTRPAWFELSEDRRVNGLPLKAGQRIGLDELGGFSVGTLSADHRVGGVLCRAGHEIVLEEGKLHRFVPAEPFVFESWTFAADGGVTLPSEPLNYVSGTLAARAQIGGLPLAADRVSLNDNRLPTEGTLAEQYTVDGHVLPRGARFERLIGKDGSRLYSVRAPVPWLLRGVEQPAHQLIHPWEIDD